MQSSDEPNNSLVELRAVELPGDEDFLQELYFSTRDDLRGLFGDEQEERRLMSVQYSGQKMTYAQEYPNAAHYIILFDGIAVGRLMINRLDNAIDGIDLALLPEYRNRGIGAEILQILFAEAADRHVPFRISVVKSNPAIRLYLRSGLTVDGETPTHVLMSWKNNDGND